MSSPPLSIVVLAAGEGKRMRSRRPKVLQPVAGRPMLDHVLETARQLQPRSIHVIHGHGGEAVQAAFPDPDLHWVYQAQRLGTGHAVQQALPHIPDTHQVLVLCADVPLTRPQTLQALVAEAGSGVSLLTVVLDDPTGYGRILRDADGTVSGIVEQKDATAEQQRLSEVNTGVLCLPAGPLRRWLDTLDTGNAQGEYYLTDCIAMAHDEGRAVQPIACADPREVQGVNDREQLATVERACQQRQARTLMRDHGLGLADPARFDLRGTLTVGEDCFIDVDAIIEGEVTLGDGVRIGPFTRLQDCSVASGTEVLAHCDIEAAEIGSDCRIGPFARLRPGTILAASARVGNFVEVKQARIGAGSKINHLSYVGDARIGADVNVGAGTITCNYDGRDKHVTQVDDGVFIGSNSALVAPVHIASGATIGAGTILRDDVAADSLAVDRGHVRQIAGWGARRDG
ncbi:bifunctional UDP-N-acetylglucosamine diphosphorylase/glucosamine-1-phosphate N-acetyltransferase GlmU [Spiribacter vilamensis]|uniref:Bifunctional protein GlmU n=1 Tax=Spiribacter vilamensis TaxID=531306 RepID=A0A4Q8D2A9_9GAMM|nr:bifunctional UDP-N-acetylglucosamine diphosphorylase/glucosamine-1-phosphate N-acetyltransferase GlmU [Spiribacter vilamensis]RZU99541.1 UDP-N-acetylglucosamine pyrophosphorylase /glucosamine-1-phosphate N-acetyltransferase [Spiribacter vilamensis]TVO61489.1 UDP-N-acetylglucosamine diphosphorylase/glucosamine-1-phosphate N-acetyltransferase [Spiribacter vilamensis]